MDFPLSMPVRPLGVSRDSHNWIAVGNETLLFTSDVFFELDVLVLEVLVMDREVYKGRTLAWKETKEE
jgi:hypothetical protein